MSGRYALIVANDTYDDPKLRRLRSPERDAEALAGVLRDPAIGDFDVASSDNDPDHLLRRRIAAFFADRDRDDLLLLHISCHGLKDISGELYFASPDTEVDQLDATAVSAEYVVRQMTRSRSRQVVVLLDCCYSGAISRAMPFRAGDDVAAPERLGGRGRAVITASSAIEYAFEYATDGEELTGAGTPSVFTSAVVSGLATGDADRDGDELISVSELYEYVSDEVRRATPYQRPAMLSHLEGELYIAHARRRAPVPSVGELQRLRHDGEVRGVAFGPDATLLATASDDSTARVWNLATGGGELRRFTHANRGRAARKLLAVAFNPRGTTIATAGRDRTARVWDVSDGRQLLRVTHKNWVRAVAFSPDGEQLATAGADGTVRVWSVPARREVLTIDGPTPVNSVAFSPDGTCLATAGHDGSARVWDLGAERLLLRAPHIGVVWAVAFSPEGQRIATASDDRTARIWDLSDGAEIRSIRHAGAVWAVAFNPAGTRLATAGDGAAAQVWDLADGREVHRVSHDDVVWAVAFSPTGNRLATASADHTARLWDV